MKVFLNDWNGVMTDVKPHLDVVDDIYEADILVLWNDVSAEAPRWIEEANAADIKTVVMVHGCDAATDYLPPRSWPAIADKYLTWGQKDKDSLLLAGVEEDRIAVTGSAFMQGRFEERSKHEGKNVLFVPLHSIRDQSYNEELHETIDKAGFNIITKATEEHEGNKYKNVVESSRFGTKLGHAEACYMALREADVVVTNYWGTMGLLAAYMDIPLICTDQFDGTKDFAFVNKGMNSEAEYSIAEVCSLEELPDVIKETLKNPDKRKEERKNVAEYYLNKGNNHNALENILNEINKTYGHSEYFSEGNIDTTL